MIQVVFFYIKLIFFNSYKKKKNPPKEKYHTDTALFSVTRRTGHVYLFFEIVKVLQGDPEVSVDPYAKIAVILFFFFFIIIIIIFLK